MYSWDLAIFRWFNSWAGVNGFYDWWIVAEAEYYLYLVIAGVFALFFFGRQRQKAKWVFIHAFAAGIIARFVFKPAIVFFWQRERPFAALEGVRKILNEIPNNAFPSGHATFSFAVAMAVYFYYPRTSILFFVAALSMGLARVSAGVHWPSDILGGAILGILTAWALELLFKKLKINRV